MTVTMNIPRRYCQQTEPVHKQHGYRKTARSFQVNCCYNAHKRGVKHAIVDMALPLLRRPTPIIIKHATLWLRALVAMVFTYGFTWGICALGAVLLTRAGMVRTEAVMVFSVAGFLIYLVAALWAVATTRLWRTALLLAGSGVLTTIVAYTLAPQLADTL